MMKFNYKTFKSLRNTWTFAPVLFRLGLFGRAVGLLAVLEIWDFYGPKYAIALLRQAPKGSKLFQMCSKCAQSDEIPSTMRDRVQKSSRALFSPQFVRPVVARVGILSSQVCCVFDKTYAFPALKPRTDPFPKPPYCQVRGKIDTGGDKRQSTVKHNNENLL